MGSVTNERDFTARATIRNAALGLFAERGHDAVTVREIAAAAGVSPALVLHHFGSKDGLRVAVDAHAAESLDAIFAELGGQELTEMLASGEATTSVAEAFVQVFPPGSPLPAYLRRLLLTNDPAGAALFGRWYATTRGVLDAMIESGVAAPTEDPAVRAAFLLVSDLAVILLREQIATAIGDDPLTPTGLARWAKDVTAVYARGAFATLEKEPPS
ncbi:TetR family transcriptional regulator [Arthrobacter livingstonensis]|uniref:TetR family transcriptional regulator n=1 Tax=Arthrobacter livingstonensis TaxID=670078 RepID=A0A2V5L3P1_9MICC|nr:TetR/AcrR family transcriptional regulator [Arthrobacter livingstonensis]PYI64343.1 TetR family transcriptional regulator [Arthrobacter livingstonensis]